MRYLRVTDDATREDIAEAIGNLRAKQKACSLAEIREDISADIDELLEMLGTAKAGRLSGPEHEQGTE